MIKSDNSKNELNLAEQVLNENAYLRSIIENNSFYIIKTDLNGNYTYLNPFFCKQLGIKSDEFIGKQSLSLVMSLDHQACLDTVTKCFENPQNSHWVILRKPSPNGVLSTQWEFKLVLNENNEPFEVLCIGHDITPLILKQQELQGLVDLTADQNKRLINFTYIVSHNIRSHVANIIGIVNISEDMQDDKLVMDMLKDSTKSLDQTINNLNEVISIQANTNLPLKKINIFEEISRIVNSIQVLVNTAETSINYSFETETELYTNPAYFESILLNLITNALKYRDPGRPLILDLHLDHEENYLVLTFTDNGQGIDMKKYSAEMFGMYKTFHKNQDARGLGLFIVKTQIEAMKGKIEVESTLNVGTTFRLYFRIN